jgi:pyruvate,orthophosphate dikinase
LNCCPLQRKDFIRILEVMDGLPVTIRLLDPPLHEFLPDLTETVGAVAVAEEQGTPNEADLRLLRAVRRCTSPTRCSGLRGVRLGLVVQGLFAMQVRAIARGGLLPPAARRRPAAEIMIPLVGSVPRARAGHRRGLAGARRRGRQARLHAAFPIGTMIELPRAA